MQRYTAVLHSAAPIYINDVLFRFNRKLASSAPVVDSPDSQQTYNFQISNDSRYRMNTDRFLSFFLFLFCFVIMATQKLLRQTETLEY